MEVVVAAEIVAFEAPIQTVFWLNVGLKPVPVSVMFDPGIAFVGENEVIVGGTVIAVIKVKPALLTLLWTLVMRVGLNFQTI